MKEKLRTLLALRYEPTPVKALERLAHSFSPAERVVFTVCAVLLALGAGLLLLKVNELFLVEMPARGGALSEGIVGSPRFVNPLLALSDADRDLSALVYSGLLKATPDGTLVPDLAERYDISEDGRTYSFTIREGARFHDGTPVTADDVVFTIQKAQDPALKSPKRANWEGVAVAKRSEREVALTLKQPYAPFLENATLGILPKHLWKDTDAEQFPFSPYNLNAVGSGPYRIAQMKRTDSGTPALYTLAPFVLYALGAPRIAELTLRFYQNEKELLAAFARKEIASAGALAPEAAEQLQGKGARVERTSLPRIFAVFFNQSQQPLFAENAVRQALAFAVEKDLLVKEVLHGYGVPVHTPVPPPLFPEPVASAPETDGLHAAMALLERAKWTKNSTTGIRERKKGKETERLSFSLVTSNVPELKESAELIREMWENLGIETRVQIFEPGDLNQNVIRPRKYDALLFGEVVGRDADLFAFWHSSQRNDPGLNVALYTNSKVDKLLEKARREQDGTVRAETNRAAVAAIRDDTPAVFLYSPDFIYLLPTAVKGFRLGRLAVPSERFADVHNWYMTTEKVWNVFAKQSRNALEF